MRLTCFALLAAALAAGCADPPPSQTLSGRVATDDFPARVLGVRAVEEGVVVAQGPVDANGRFSLNVPKGGHYRLEVVTRAGIHQFITPDHGSPRVMAFDACGDSYDFGDVGFWEEGDPLPDCNGGDDGSGGGDGTDPGQCTDPMDPDCNGGCDPSTGMDCCDPATGIGCGDPPPPCADGDPNCEPPPPYPCPDDDPMCDPCAIDPAYCDPCLADPTLCEDPCLQDPSLCQDPCADNPEMCDPCLTNPEWCWPGDCVQADGTTDPNTMDNSGCWPDDPTCSDDDPNCWPQPVDPPACADDGMVDPDGNCWDEPPQGALPEDPPPDNMCP